MTYPLSMRSRLISIPLILGSIIASFYLLGIIKNILESFSSVFSILIIALIITVILKPIVDLLKRNKVAPLLAIMFSFVLLFAIISIISMFMLPALYNELNLVADKFPDITSNQRILSFLSRYNIGSNALTNSTILLKLNQFVDYAVNNSFAFIQNFFTIFLDLFIAFFFAFYFLFEGEKFKKWIVCLSPTKYREDISILSDAVIDSLQGFIKGQTIVAGLIAIATMIVMQILGLNLVIICGVFVFITMFIPVVGPFICIILPVMVALFNSVYAAIILCILLFCIIQIVVNFIQPKIFSKSLGIHPVLAVLAVLIGAQAFGIAGALLALPLASVVQTLVIYYLHK